MMTPEINLILILFLCVIFIYSAYDEYNAMLDMKKELSRINKKLMPNHCGNCKHWDIDNIKMVWINIGPEPCDTDRQIPMAKCAKETCGLIPTWQYEENCDEHERRQE